MTWVGVLQSVGELSGNFTMPVIVTFAEQIETEAGHDVIGSERWQVSSRCGRPEL